MANSIKTADMKWTDNMLPPHKIRVNQWSALYKPIFILFSAMLGTWFKWCPYECTAALWKSVKKGSCPSNGCNIISCNTNCCEVSMKAWSTLSSYKQQVDRQQWESIQCHWPVIPTEWSWSVYWYSHPLTRGLGILLALLLSHVFRADSRIAPSQWEMSLQGNAVSHWLGANLESALIFIIMHHNCTSNQKHSGHVHKHSVRSHHNRIQIYTIKHGYSTYRK